LFSGVEQPDSKQSHTFYHLLSLAQW